MVKIKIAKNSGFCFGVKRAVDMTYALIEKYKGKKQRIYTLGALIHNEIVVEELSKQGVDSIEALEQAVKGDVVVIRSHGASKHIFEEAAKKRDKISGCDLPLCF